MKVNFNELINIIYEEPLTQKPWQQLGALREALTAQDIYLVLRQPYEGDIGLAFFDGPSASASPHAAYYSQQLYTSDPFLNLPPNKSVLLSDIISKEELVQLEYFKLALAPHNIFDMIGLNIRDQEGLRANLRVTRNSSQPPFGEAERQLCDNIAPHLTRALRIYNRISELESERSTYAVAMAQLAMATIFLDEKRLIYTTNPAADYLLEQENGFGVRNSTLYLQSGAQHKQLCLLIDEIIQAQRSGKMDLAKALLVESNLGDTQYSFILRPLPIPERPENTNEPTIALFISKLDQPIGASTNLLQELFNLTPAEANLAVLLTNGHTIEQAATELHISPHTVRAHLRSIFSKTHVSRQSDLIRLILSSASSLG